jgi:hypothetical protein
MKTIEPIFMLLYGDLYPVLTKYNAVRLFRGKLWEIELVMVKSDRRITSMRLDAITVYDLDEIRNSKFNKDLDRTKFVHGLDDDYYPSQAIIEDAVRESIDNIVAEQSILVEELGCSKRFLKWQTYEKLLDYVTSPPKDLIEVVRKDILE